MTYHHRRHWSSSSSSSWEWWGSWPTPTWTNNPNPNPNYKRVWFPRDDALVDKFYFHDLVGERDYRKSVPISGYIESPNRMFWVSCYRSQMLMHLQIIGQPFMDSGLKDDLWWSFVRRQYDDMVNAHQKRTFNSPTSWCSRKASIEVWCPCSRSFVERAEMWNEPLHEPLNPLVSVPAQCQIENEDNVEVKRRRT